MGSYFIGYGEAGSFDITAFGGSFPTNILSPLVQVFLRGMPSTRAASQLRPEKKINDSDWPLYRSDRARQRRQMPTIGRDVADSINILAAPSRQRYSSATAGSQIYNNAQRMGGNDRASDVPAL